MPKEPCHQRSSLIAQQQPRLETKEPRKNNEAAQSQRTWFWRRSDMIWPLNGRKMGGNGRFNKRIITLRDTMQNRAAAAARKKRCTPTQAGHSTRLVMRDGA